MKRRRPRSSKQLKISFGITVVVLSTLVLLGLSLLPQPVAVITKHIPDTIPTFSGVIGDYAPSDALQVSYNDFAAVRSINATALPRTNYLRFASPVIGVNVTAIQQRISVVLSEPNATVDVTILDPATFHNLSQTFQLQATPKGNAGGTALYVATDTSAGTEVQTWVAFLQDTASLLVCQNGAVAPTALTKVLSVYHHSAPSLIDSPEFQRMLYVANGTTGHLGVSMQNFVGVVNTGKATLITVDRHGSSIWINHLVSFQNSTRAASQIGYFQKVYLGSNLYESYDDVLLAAQYQPLSSLAKSISVVG